MLSNLLFLCFSQSFTIYFKSSSPTILETLLSNSLNLSLAQLPCDALGYLRTPAMFHLLITGCSWGRFSGRKSAAHRVYARLSCFVQRHSIISPIFLPSCFVFCIVCCVFMMIFSIIALQF